MGYLDENEHVCFEGSECPLITTPSNARIVKLNYLRRKKMENTQKVAVRVTKEEMKAKRALDMPWTAILRHGLKDLKARLGK